MRVSTIPTSSFGYGSAAVCNNEIHAVSIANATSHYKWDGTSWTCLETSFSSSTGVVSYKDTLYKVNSGSDRYILYKYENTQWVEVMTFVSSYQISQSAVTVCGDYLFILGSSDSSYYTYGVKISFATLSSTSLRLPYSVYNTCAVSVNNEVHLLGSYYTSANTNHYKYNNVDNSWIKLKVLPYPFYVGSALDVNNEIQIFGSGKTENRTSHYGIGCTRYIKK